MADLALLEEILFALVTKPEQVRIDVVEQGEQVHYSIAVAEEDVGLVLGKKGRIIEALRVLFGATGFPQGKRNQLHMPQYGAGKPTPITSARQGYKAQVEEGTSNCKPYHLRSLPRMAY
jgi:predicted RNA-binding protein YlqC (UPF0109 family)